MSLLINGMEMPTDHSLWIVVNKDGTVEYNYFGEWKTAGEKAVPVQPHGRLIDADAYCAEMKKRQDACTEWRDEIKSGGGYGTDLFYRTEGFLGAMCEAKLTIDKMPTIIPAEEEET